MVWGCVQMVWWCVQMVWWCVQMVMCVIFKCMLCVHIKKDIWRRKTDWHSGRQEGKSLLPSFPAELQKQSPNSTSFPERLEIFLNFLWVQVLRQYRMVSARNAEAVHGPRFEFPIQAEFIVKRWNWIPNCTFFYGQKIPTSTSTWLLYVLVQCLLIRIIKDDVDN